MKTTYLKSIPHLILLMLLLLVLLTTDYPITTDSYAPAVIAIIIAIYLSLFIFKSAFSPIVFTLIFFLLQPLLGYLNYSYIRTFIPYTDINFSQPLLIWFVYVIFFEIGFLVHRSLKKSIPTQLSNPTKIINKNGIEILAFILIIISIISTIFFTMRTGGIPFFMGKELDVARFEWIKLVDSGVIKLISFSVVGTVLLIYLILTGKIKCKIGIIVLAIYALVSSFYFGDRIKLLLIILFGIFCFFKINKKIKIKYVVFILILLFLILQIFGFIAYWRGGWAFTSKNIFIRTVQLFTEFWDFSRAQNTFQPNDIRLRDYNIFYSVYSLIPRQVLSIFNIDKTRLMSIATFSGAYSEYYSSRYDLRFSAIGDLYFSFGYYGVFFIFLLGFLYGIINKIFIHMNIQYPYFNTISFFIVLLSLLPMLEIKTILDYINVYIFTLFVVEFLTKKSGIGNLSQSLVKN